MRDHQNPGPEMSATILSAFYDMDLLYKQENSVNMNALHMNSLLDQKAVGSPVTSSCLYRRTCSSTSESTRSSVVKCSHSHVRESSSTAIMNKENRCRERAFSDSGERAQHQLTSQQHKSVAQINSTRYKTELCRPFEENGSCKYGEKCQFAHGYHELRSLSRHPKYKTEPCRTFHTIGFCPYGPRCHFIHNAEERRAAPADTSKAGGAGGFRPKLHHSLSFSGFSNHHHGLDSPTSRTPPPASSSSSFYDEVMSPGSVTRCLSNSAFSFPGPNSAYVTQSGGSYYGNLQLSLAGPPSPPYGLLNPLSESPVFDSPPSPPDSLSDRDSYASGSLSSTGSLSGSESPSLDGGRRLPIFSRLSISDD